MPMSEGAMSDGPMSDRPASDTPPPLLPVADALDRILRGLAPSQTEICELQDVRGRVLATDIAARLSLPPA
ncbi:MAG: hypothetical protein VXB94_04000, partial [Rhodobiaceae bacterium]